MASVAITQARGWTSPQMSRPRKPVNEQVRALGQGLAEKQNNGSSAEGAVTPPRQWVCLGGGLKRDVGHGAS